MTTMDDTFTCSSVTREILDGIDKANKAAAERGSGKDLILILGNTGAGKSTFVNYLVGKKMREERVPNSLNKGFVCDDPVMEIGHGFESKTTFPESCSDAASNLTFCDCPGFMDNRGVVFDITNMYAITKMAQLSRSVKGIVIIFNYHALEADRAKGLQATISLLHTIFGSHAAEHAKSALLLVTRVPPHTTRADLRSFFSAAVASGQFTSSDVETALFQHLAANCEFYDPLDQYCRTHQRLSRAALIDKLKGFTGIPHQQLNVGLPASSLNALDDVLTEVEAVATAAFTENRIPAVENYLSIVEGLKVLRCAPVERHAARFQEFMIGQLHTWANNLENLAMVQDIGAALPVLRAHVDDIVKAMVDRIEEKRHVGEQIELMEGDLELAKKDIKRKSLENEKLEEESKLAKARADANEAEAGKLRIVARETERKLELAKQEEERLREQLNRPQPVQSGGMDMGMLCALMSMMGGGGGGGFDGGGGGGSSSSRRSSGATGSSGTVYRGRGRPRNSDRKPDGSIRYK